MKRIAIFASGQGTNAQAIIDHFQNNAKGRVVTLLSNNQQAYALKRASKANIETMIFDNQTFRKTERVIDYLMAHNIDLIVLAGFMWLVPDNIIQAYNNKIINIHPALLPKFGGKGMYGHHVHQAVIDAHEKQSGITIHWVNNQYDSGDIIFQATCDITPEDTPDSLAEKIHALEHKHFPQIIEKIL